MFDDHIVVESPGKLPGLVRADNIRFTHFSRNPKIAEVIWDIVRLIRLKVITYDDLSDFSDELQMEVKRILAMSR